MNLRSRLILERHLQQAHNNVSHAGDRAVMVGAVVIAVVLAALSFAGVIA